MKNVVFVFAILINLNFLNAFEGNEGFYVGILGGANMQNAEKKHDSTTHSQPGFVVGLNAGYAFMSGFRGEAEFSFRRNQLNTYVHEYRHYHPHTRYQSFALMANAYYDFQTCWRLKAFFGGGLGYNFREASYRYSSHFKMHLMKYHLAYQAILGIAYPIFENTDLALEYRLFRGDRKPQDYMIGITLKRFF